jgi:hypothetical protein
VTKAVVLLTPGFNAFQPLNHFHRVGNPIFGSNFCTQRDCALTQGGIRDGCLDGLREPISGQFGAWNRRWPNSESVNALTPKGLIAEEWNHDGRYSCPKASRSRPGATMMNYRRHTREKPGMRNRANHQNRVGQVCFAQSAPTRKQERALVGFLQRLEYQVGCFFWLAAAHTAKANIHGGRPGLQKIH